MPITMPLIHSYFSLVVIALSTSLTGATILIVHMMSGNVKEKLKSQAKLLVLTCLTFVSAYTPCIHNYANCQYY